MKKINNKYPIAVVTYKRKEIKTLDYLNGFKNVFVFVENKECLEMVDKKYREKYKFVITNTQNLPQKRNFIMDYFFKDGQSFVFCDDDIDGIYKKKDNKLVKLDCEGVYNLIKMGFETAVEYKTNFWGVYPVVNAFYMQDKITKCGFIITSFCGLLPSDIRIDEKYIFKNDYYLSAKSIVKNGCIVRFDNYCVDAKHYNKTGGLSEFRNDELEKKCCDYLISEFPFLFIRNKKRKNQVLMKNIVR